MRRRDRAIKKIVAWAISLLYHRVEVRQAPGLTAEGPTLANASHFGGFSDPLLLIHAMDRVPRFIGRDVIWKNPIARVIVNWIGAIPVHKPEDGGGSANDQMFGSTYKALHESELVTIFPEGITVDDPSIARIKTGSARIALGARNDGVEGLQLVSSGIHYSNKAALRSDVFIDVGWPIDLDANIDSYTAGSPDQSADNREAVRALTDDMERRLRLAAPDFEDWTTARALTKAAAVALRPSGDDPEPGHADRERLARLLDDAPSPSKGVVVDAVHRYEDDLDALGLNDDMFVSGLGTALSFMWHIIRTAVVGLILLPFAIIGLIVNAIPLAIVWLVGRLRVADAMMATIKPLAALVVFLITWVGWVIWISQAADYGLAAAAAVLMPVYLTALIAWTERMVLLGRGFNGLVRSRSGRGLRDQVAAHRRMVAEAVADAL